MSLLNPPNAINTIGRNSSNLIKAYVRIPYFHKAVEELINNSLDSNSTKIEIIVRASKLSVEVCDNGKSSRFIQNLKIRALTRIVHNAGDGIPAVTLGQCGYCWDLTSQSPGKYGSNGTTLAALLALSTKLEIVSKTREGGHTLKSICSQSDSQPTVRIAEAPIRTPSGTRVIVSNMYHNLPPREKSMRPHVEIARIRDFVQHMAVLHHRVGWRLVDGDARKVLAHLPPQLSVGARYASFHGDSQLCKMQVL
jgi:DNA mismatch repair ATPase MutL